MAQPGVRERIPERTNAALADSTTRDRQRAHHWQAMATLAVREKIAERTRMAMADPSVRERILAGMAQRSVEVELRLFHVLWAALSADARKRIATEIASFGQSGCL
jgi:hypothetical protein